MMVTISGTTSSLERSIPKRASSISKGRPAGVWYERGAAVLCVRCPAILLPNVWCTDARSRCLCVAMQNRLPTASNVLGSALSCVHPVFALGLPDDEKTPRG